MPDADVQPRLGGHRAFEEADLLNSRDGAAEGGHAARVSQQASLQQFRVKLREADADAVAPARLVDWPVKHLHALDLLHLLQRRHLHALANSHAAAQHRACEDRALAAHAEAVVHGE